MFPIISARKKIEERFGTMMRVNDKRFHAGRDQVIEDKRDQRFLENRDERFGQVFRERPEPHSQTGGENESLVDHRLPTVGRDSVEPGSFSARRSLALPKLVSRRESDKP